MIKLISLLGVVTLLTACNPAFIQGVAQGMSEGMNRNSYGNSSVSSELARQKRELRKMKSDLSYQCIMSGGVLVATSA